MARDDSPPFARGETFYNGGTIDSNNLGGHEHVGKIYVFEDIDLTPGSVGAKAARTNRRVVCMIVRNVAAAAILPKRLVTLQSGGSDGRYLASRVDGYARTSAARAYPVDEFLPAAGCPVNDLCYIVIEGPAKLLSPLDGGADNVFNVGDVIVALTAITSGATTAGRANLQDVTGATTALASNIQNAIGHALSALTTGNTNADLLVDVGKW